MDRLTTILLVIWCCALTRCNARDDVADPPPSTSTIAPAPDPPPPLEPCTAETPLDSRRPDCYLTTGRMFQAAPGRSSLQVQLENEAQELINTARNFDRVVSWGCYTSGPPFDMTHDRLSVLAEAMFRTHYGRESEAIARARGPKHPSYVTWLERMVVHRKCTTEGGDWCEHTAIYKPVWEPWFVGWNAALTAARDVESRGASLGFDGIRAWCKAQ